MRHGAAILVMACMMAVMMPAQMLTAFAASAKITFSDPSATVGSQVKVNMKISSSSNLANADIMLSYDANALEFVSGTNAEGGAGAVRVHGDAGTPNTGTLAFTLQFNALAAGSSKISVTSQEIYDSSSQLVTVDHEGSSTVTVSALQTASKDATLKSLKVSPGELSPAFSPDVDTYAVTVGTDVDKLIISADTTDDNANKVISGNEGLQMGENRVTCKVTAQDGETAKEYVIVVTKAEGGASAASADAGEQVKMEISRRTITILPPDESVKVPDGFKTSTINIDGHKVKGWVWGADQEPQYCVVYGMNEAGEKNFYRYDMKDSERTIQRYFEDPAASSMVTSDQYNTLAVQYDKVREDFNLFRILLAVTVAIAVVLLIILLVVVMNKKGKGGGRDGDTPEEPGGSRSRAAAKKRKQISSEGEDEYQEDEDQAYEDEDGYGDEYDEYDEYDGQEFGDEDDEDEPDEDGRVYDDRREYEYQMGYEDEGEYEDRDEDADEREEAARRRSRTEHRPSRASQPLEPVQPMESVKPIDPVEPPKAVRPPKSAGPSRPSRPAQSGRPDRTTGSAQPTRPVQTSKPEQPAGLAQDDVNDDFEIFDL